MTSNRMLTKLLLMVVVALTIVSGEVMQYYTRSRCSRQCPCYYNSLFCKGYKLTTLPDDISPSVQNMDLQVRSHIIILQMYGAAYTLKYNVLVKTNLLIIILPYCQNLSMIKLCTSYWRHLWNPRTLVSYLLTLIPIAVVSFILSVLH